jgi:tetratricopeptide (TPR) repeat protein
VKTGLIVFVSSIAGFLIIPITQIDAGDNVSWLLFEDKNGFFTLKYPSNWSPYKYIEDSSAPINIYFAYAGSGSSFAELVLSGEESIHTNVTNLVDTYPLYLQSYPDYKVVQETQCGKYTIDNISACHLIMTYRNTDLDGQPTVYELVVGTLDDKGMEYILVYYVTKDLYDHFLPVAEHMISSFDVTDNTTNIDEETSEKGINKTYNNEIRNDNQSLSIMPNNQTVLNNTNVGNESLSTVPNNQTVLNNTNVGNESLSTVPNNQTVLNNTNVGNESLSTVPNNQTVLNNTNVGNESLSDGIQIKEFFDSPEFYDAKAKAKGIITYILSTIFPQTGEEFTNTNYGVDIVFPKNWTGFEMRIIFPMAVVSPEGFNITGLFSEFIDPSLDIIAESIVSNNTTELSDQEFQKLIEPKVRQSAESLSTNLMENMENNTSSMSVFIYDKELIHFINSVNPNITESVDSLASLNERLVDASNSTITCDRITSNQTVLNNNITAEVSTERCLFTGSNRYHDSLNYFILTPRALVGIQYSSDASDENDKYIGEFEEALKTLSVKESLPINNQTIQQFVNSKQPTSLSMNASSSKLVERGNSFYDLKMYEEAISWYDKALAVNPNDVNASYYKGTAFDELHRYEDALSWFDKTLDIYPKHVNASIYKAIVLKELGKLEEAISWYDKALEIDPKNLNALYNKAGTLYDLGRYEEALTWYDKAIEIDPEKIDALYGKAVALAGLDIHEEAIIWFDKALEIDSKFVMALNGKGVSLDKLGEHEDAINLYDEVLAIDPESVHALNNKGLALGSLEKYQEAIGFYDKALEIDPKDVGALLNKGSAFGKLGKLEEAVIWFDKALEIDPQNFMTLYNKAISLGILDRHEDAIIWYDKALSVDPKDVGALGGKGTSLYNLGKYEEAIIWYDKTLAIDPKSLDALFGKGTSLYDLGKYEEAISWYDKALAIDAGYMGALINKGGAFFRLGMNDDALMWLDKAFDIDPEWLDKKLEKDPNNEELLELKSLIEE